MPVNFFFKVEDNFLLCGLSYEKITRGGELKSNELNLKVEFEETFDIDNFSKSEQDVFFSSLLENLSKIYDKTKVEECD